MSQFGSSDPRIVCICFRRDFIDKVKDKLFIRDLRRTHLTMHACLVLTEELESLMTWNQGWLCICVQDELLISSLKFGWAWIFVHIPVEACSDSILELYSLIFYFFPPSPNPENNLWGFLLKGHWRHGEELTIGAVFCSLWYYFNLALYLHLKYLTCDLKLEIKLPKLYLRKRNCTSLE